MAISQFTGAFFFLSNFAETPVSVRGMVFPTAEHAFQCAKTVTDDDFWWVLGQTTPGRAKRAASKKGLNGRTITLREDWEEVKIDIMREIVRAKFTGDDELREALLETGDQKLVEGNNWGDRYWGKVDNEGENWLGRILMDVREELRQHKI